MLRFRGIQTLVILTVLISSSLCFAQGASIPGPPDYPMGDDVRGFMQLSFGFSGWTSLSLSPESRVEDTQVWFTDQQLNIPGFAASLTFIPTWGHNGFTVAATYDLGSADLHQEVSSGIDEYKGDSTVSVADTAIRAGYIRYFGDQLWHPNLFADVGYSFQSMKIATDYDKADDEVHESKGRTPIIGAGVGLAREAGGGLLGGELRVDYNPIPTRFEYSDPAGKADLDVTRPIIIKLMVIFSIGRL